MSSQLVEPCADRLDEAERAQRSGPGAARTSLVAGLAGIGVAATVSIAFSHTAFGQSAPPPTNSFESEMQNLFSTVCGGGSAPAGGASSGSAPGARGQVEVQNDGMSAAQRRAVEQHLRELNGIPGFSCVDPSGAFYAFPNVTKTGIGAKKLELALLEEVGVAVIAGTSFGAYGEGYLRFSYANGIENILAACTRIRAWLQEKKLA